MEQKGNIAIVIAFFIGVFLLVGIQTGVFDFRAQTVPSGAIIQFETDEGVRGTGTDLVDLGERCVKDDDCTGATMICNEEQTCTPLINPLCTCSQPQVLQCADSGGKAKHTFCEKGCRITPQGPRCL